LPPVNSHAARGQHAPPLWSARRLLAAAFVCALLSATLFLVDRWLAKLLISHPLPGELARLVRLAELFAWGGSVAFIILTAVVLDPRGWQTVLPLAGRAYGAGLIANGCKLLVARWRPSAAERMGVTETFLAWLPLAQQDALPEPYGYALQSFPSAHAATATGLALGLAALYPRGRWLFVGFAALACFQRMAAHAHFASDLLAGIAIGCLVGAAFQCLSSPELPDS
jgi:membrane-associated phospholipid phosphatase